MQNNVTIDYNQNHEQDLLFKIQEYNYKVLVPLYKLQNAKIYTWTIQLEYNTESNSIDIHTYYGYQHKKITKRSFNIPKGKTKRSLLEQAQLEAISKWKNKHQKQLFLLQIEEHNHDQAKISSELQSIENNDEQDESNSNQSNNNTILFQSFRPMLAQSFHIELYLKHEEIEHKNKQCDKIDTIDTTDKIDKTNKTIKINKTSNKFKLTFPINVQPKLDGIRCLATMNYETNKVTLQTRNGLCIDVFDQIVSELQIFFQRLYEITKTKTIVLDGELYTNTIPFEILSGLVRAKKTDKLNNAGNETRHQLMRQIHYHIFDYCDFTNKAFFIRMDELQTVFNQQHMINKINSFMSIEIVETTTVASINELTEKHTYYISKQYEGIIARDPYSAYEVNKRSKYLQKYKTFQDEEFTIVGFSEEGDLGSELIIFECCLNNTKDNNNNNKESIKTFNVRPIGSADYRRDLYSRRTSLIGKQLTVTFQEKSCYGIPRFPTGKSIREE